MKDPPERFDRLAMLRRKVVEERRITLILNRNMEMKDGELNREEWIQLDRC